MNKNDIKFIQVTRAIGNAFIVSFQLDLPKDNNPLVFTKIITSDGETLCEWADKKMPKALLVMFQQMTDNNYLLDDIHDEIATHVPEESREDCEMIRNFKVGFKKEDPNLKSMLGG